MLLTQTIDKTTTNTKKLRQTTDVLGKYPYHTNKTFTFKLEVAWLLGYAVLRWTSTWHQITYLTALLRHSSACDQTHSHVCPKQTQRQETLPDHSTATIASNNLYRFPTIIAWINANTAEQLLTRTKACETTMHAWRVIAMGKWLLEGMIIVTNSVRYHVLGFSAV
jgi:hypothetical protein